MIHNFACNFYSPRIEIVKDPHNNSTASSKMWEIFNCLSQKNKPLIKHVMYDNSVSET